METIHLLFTLYFFVAVIGIFWAIRTNRRIEQQYARELEKERELMRKHGFSYEFPWNREDKA